jgi:DNA-binding LytR/AlgR family response regulator
MNCYIVDDEAHAVALLKTYIGQTPGLVLCGSSTNPLQALEELRRLKAPDLIFIDVDMPELNGLQLAGLVNADSTIVFTTAYREYALEAFEKEAADYLVKPIAYERFLKCIQKFYRQARPEARQGEDEPNAIFVKTGIKGKYLRVSIPEIRYIEGADNYLIIYQGDGKTITHMTLGEILQRLPLKAFTRIHKSYIINIGYIRSVEPGQVRLTNEVCLPVGPSYRQSFHQQINQV